MRTAIVGAIGALTISVLVLGQNSSWAQDASDSPQSELAGSVDEIRLETIHTRDQLQATVDALDALTKQKSGDLRPAYDKFVDEWQKTHDAADQTVARASDMESASKDYFGTWQTEIAGISNDSLRSKSQRRLTWTTCTRHWPTTSPSAE